MPEDALRSEIHAGFAAVAQRITSIENELHRHQDEDRSDMGAMRVDIQSLTSTQERQAGRIEGSLGTLKWIIGIPAIVAAVASIVGTIHRW